MQRMLVFKLKLFRGKFAAKPGFTLAEVGVVVPILVVVLSALLVSLIAMLQSNAEARSTTKLLSDIQSSLTIIEDDLKLASQFLVTNDPAPIEDPYGSNNAGAVWSFKGSSSTNRALIVRAYATTANPLAADKEAVFLDAPNGCGASYVFLNPVQQYNIIYFVGNTTLYRRTLVDTTTPTCQSTYQLQSCPTDVAYPREAVCLADDMELMNNVTGFTVDYFVQPTGTSPMSVYSSTDSAVLYPAATVNVTITGRLGTGNPVEKSLSLRISKLN